MFDGSDLLSISGLIPEFSSSTGAFANSKPSICPLTYRCEKVIDPSDPATTTSCDYSDSETNFLFDIVSGQLLFSSTD